MAKMIIYVDIMIMIVSNKELFIKYAFQGLVLIFKCHCHGEGRKRGGDVCKGREDESKGQERGLMMIMMMMHHQWYFTTIIITTIVIIIIITINDDNE